MEPLISIIVPCYNAEAYIDRCMNSLVNQTLGLKQLEIILINDASTDSTYEKLLEWEKQYPDSILVINCTKNMRQGGARNLGVNHARGTYIAFVDADDWVDLNMYKEMTDKAITYNCDLVSCNFDRPASDGTIGTHPDQKEEFICIESETDRQNFIIRHLSYTFAWLHLYNRRWFIENDLKFPEGLLYEDHVMFLVYALANRIYILNERFYHYYKNQTSVTSTNKNPFDRIPVHQFLYSRLREPKFADIRNLADYNFYEKGIAETIFSDPSLFGDISAVRQLKEILLKQVPEILENPYYCRDLSLPNLSMEYLLHPLLEHEITNASFSLFLKRVLYCIEFPTVLLFLDQFARVRRKLEFSMQKQTLSENTLQEVSISLHEICSKYRLESYAQENKIMVFLAEVDMLCNHTSCRDKVLNLIDDFCIAITLSEDNSRAYDALTPLVLRHSSVKERQNSDCSYSMNVAISTNRKYVPISLVMLYSLFFNNSDADIHVYVLNCELTKEDDLSFTRLANAWSQQITLVTIDPRLFEPFPTTKAWSKEAYFRLLMPTILPHNLDRILYLDVDTIVNKSIREFYEMNFDGMDFVVCEDILINRAYKEKYQGNFTDLRNREFTYFNSGVMLWNLSQIRQNYDFTIYLEKLVKYINVLQCVDQDILNVVHCGKTLTVDWLKYNLQMPIALSNHFSAEIIRNTSCIIHFCGPKPWDPDTECHDLYQIWKDYENLFKQDDLS